MFLHTLGLSQYSFVIKKYISGGGGPMNIVLNSQQLHYFSPMFMYNVHALNSSHTKFLYPSVSAYMSNKRNGTIQCRVKGFVFA